MSQRWTLAGPFDHTHTKGIGGWKWRTVIQRSMLAISAVPQLFALPQPDMIGNRHLWAMFSKSQSYFQQTCVYASAAGSCISFTVKEFLECVLFASWQVMSGAKRYNLQHTHSSVNHKQRERKTNDTSVTYCRDKHNSHAQKTCPEVFFLMFHK